ncbi:MAG: hypothetical protein HOV68_30565 [Streptomycetaceae bacterium]|nr:hypothetical protein [Streptomycetaceae bacterium]
MPFPITTARRNRGQLLGLRWAARGHIGERDRQCDAWSVQGNPATGRTAFAVADGIGSHLGSWQAARWAADQGAHAALTLDPKSAVLAARAHRRHYDTRRHPDRHRAGWRPDPDYLDDNTLTLAVVDPRSPHVRCAWVGDSRIYWIDADDRVHLATRDHTWGQELRDAGKPEYQAREWDNMLTHTAAEGDVGTVTLDAALVRTLVLCSDGVGKQLTREDWVHNAKLPEGPARDAESLVGTALDNAQTGGYPSDNATVLVAYL